ncbi:hypothetical protein SAMN04488564_1021077 [Lentzea waywayandensis]|uniref:Proteins of 100 residues with WXG n=1 Tax=Lentzea waywayandensis TaxID=84724 RepID=A0A1I6DN15_9PSEU|nr:hypothetical protein [Lentzea waywayandensis]SFR06786.1 hypothetical protein SAMN04488564_1021077 [Lentzea waywayandensis]
MSYTIDVDVENDAEWLSTMNELGPACMQLLAVWADMEGEEDQLPNYLPRMEEIFRCFSSGSQHPANEIADAMRDGRDLMDAVLHKHIKDVGTNVRHWHGAAADQFLVYLNSMSLAVKEYQDALEALNLLVEAYRSLVVSMRKDVSAMVQRVFAALEAEQQSQDKIGLAVAGAFVAVIGTVVTGGTATGLVVAALSGGIGIQIEQMGASDNFHVVASMVDQGEDIVHGVNQARAKIEKGFRAVTEALVGSKLDVVRPARPEIITAPSFDPKDFALEEEYQRGHDVPAAGGPLVEAPPAKKGPDSDIDEETGLDVYPEQVKR